MILLATRNGQLLEIELLLENDKNNPFVLGSMVGTTANDPLF